MRRTRRALAATAAAVLYAALAAFAPVAPRPVAPAPPPPRAAQEDTRFATRDLVVDPRGARLAAWQVRLVDPSGRARVVGVEGGTAPAFDAPPHHDPRALAGGALVLAAYDTSGAGPTAPMTVARVHLAITGDAAPAFELTLEVAASPDGPIPGATCALVP